jgi:hypothetical protein
MRCETIWGPLNRALPARTREPEGIVNQSNSVLVTGDQGRIALTTVRALAAGGYNPVLTVGKSKSIAAASRHCVRTVGVPQVSAPGYAEAVRTEISSHPYVTCLPVNDEALLKLGRPVGHLLDKQKLLLRGEAVGFAPLPTRAFDSQRQLAETAEELDYPVVIKPVIRDRRAFRLESAKQVRQTAIAEGPLLVQPFIDESIRTIGGVMWRDRMIAAVHQRWLRIWPPECGQASAVVTTQPNTELEERIVALLEGYEGVFHVQLVGPHLMDVHPRPYGLQTLALAAGVNLAGIWCDLVSGKQVAPVRAPAGVFYRWLAGDLRHMGWALRERRLSLRGVVGGLRPRRRTAHGTESLRDPGPTIARIRFHLDRARSAQSRGK